VAESEHGHGWVRINLRGREPQGMVEPGAEYEALCEEIADELRLLTDDSSGTPAVAEVVRPAQLLEGPHVDELPDLLVRWTSSAFLRAVRHPQVGLIEEDLRDVPRTEHSGEGFLVASGPRIRRGATAEAAEIADLAPTLLYLLGAPVPEAMDGRVLTELIAETELSERAPAREAIDLTDERWAEHEAV
jgi:predicted AlkP superfamily phosphohydrolase/phosphomutase